MEHSLERSPNRPAILVFALAAGLLLSYQAIRLWLADHRIHSDRVDIIERGAALEPGNAEAWDTLGRYHQLDFADPDPARALSDYQMAIHDDPLSANYWMNLAGAYEAGGDISRAHDAFQHARDAYPLSAEVAWNYGNFLLRQDQDAAGYAQIHNAVQSDPRLLTLAISRVWRSSRDANILLDQILPANVDAYFQALDFFSSIHKTDPALAVWQRLISLHVKIDLPRTFPFFDALILDDRSDEAKRSWVQALAAAGLPHDLPANHSLIWNGAFSHDLENGGLGWRWNTPLGVAIDFDSTPPSHGARSLRLDFGGGSNLQVSEPMQYVAVEPGRSYHFHALMRTEEITTESGMRFSLVDSSHPAALNLLTENLMGSHEWAAEDLDFTTGPQTHFLTVRLFRAGSRLFDNKLSGSVWLADVTLLPAASPSENSSR